MSEESLLRTDWRGLILRWTVLAIIWASGYAAFQIARDELLTHWLRLVLVYYSLFSALVGIAVLAIIIWKLSRELGHRYDW